MAYIRSVTMTRFDGQEGYLDDRVFVSLEQVMGSGDPWGYCKHRLGMSLAACVKTSGIPLNEGAWLIEFSPFAQANFNCPPTAVL